jgi:beta-fructofuranosidase
MSALTNDLKKLTAAAEKTAAMEGGFRQKFHLMPPTGWLNDPNGLCQSDGVFHAFFQYSPFDPEGGAKLWGHYTSRNMIDWEYKGVPLYPDQPFDCSGVYSGCAYLEDGQMYLYYTGNVKLEDRDDYDYVNTGREANTVLVTSPDGKQFSRKRLLMRNSDYPSDLTLHVRDPKVWKEDGVYYMLQGARSKDDVGQGILFRSDDKISWSFAGRVETKEKFGYMWECPDYFETDGVKVFSASVQGLDGEEWKDRNVYQSGYFLVDGDILGEYSLSDYRLWDYGFDYYAPQSFEAEDGRRILIGWMGMPDCDEYTNLTIREGWQHCFTFPREVFVRDGIVCQRPVRELDERKRPAAAAEGTLERDGDQAYEADITGIRNNSFRAVVGEELVLEYRDGRFEMRFEDQAKDAVSGGRSLRYRRMEELRSVKILADVSSVEVFINGGEYVFSTRYYPKKYRFCVEAEGAEIVFNEILAKPHI